MPIRITCPHCRDAYPVDDSLLGKRARCRSCHEALTVRPDRPRVEDDDRPDRRVSDRPAPRAADRRPRGDQDDAPRRPARRRDEGDEDDRPRRPAAGGGSLTPVLVAGGIGGALLLLGLVVGATYLFSSGGAQQATISPPPGAERKADKRDGGAMPAALSAGDLARVKQATAYLRVTLPAGGIAEGTGFFTGEPGVVVTNAHVLGMLRADTLPPSQVTVVVNSGEGNELQFPAKVLGVDRGNDLAVLRVAAPPARLPEPLRLGWAGGLMETQKVYIFGYPLGEQLGKNITVSESSVSSLRRDGSGVLAQVQVNGGMHQGNSGGPVTDSRGDVVGVSVAIIRGTQINFAIPAEMVRRALEGTSSDIELGAPFSHGDGGAFLPVRVAVMDPLGRVQEVKVEVWPGRPGPVRPPTERSRPEFAGDGPHRGAVAVGGAGVYTAEVPVPDLAPGQVLWAQAVITTPAGRWYGLGRAIEYTADQALERTPAALHFKPPSDGIERTLRMTSVTATTFYRGDKSVSFSHKMDGHVLEQLFPDGRGLGTGVRLTLGQPKFTREGPGTALQAPGAITAYLARFSPSFLVSGKNEAKERGARSFASVPEESRETVEELFETVCNTWEITTLPLPNRSLRPLEAWQAAVPMLVHFDGKKQVQVLRLDCIYQGLRKSGGRRLAVVHLAGQVRAPQERGEVHLGKVTGEAVIDVDRGMLSRVKVLITTEVDTGDAALRMLVTDESVVERVDGNTQGIKSAVPLPRKGKGKSSP